jgi:hypothetical protein
MVEMKTKKIGEGPGFNILAITLTEPEGGGEVISIRTVGESYLSGGSDETWFCNRNKINDELLADIVLMKGLDEAYKHKLYPAYSGDRMTALVDEKGNAVCVLLSNTYHPSGSPWGTKPQVFYIH